MKKAIPTTILVNLQNIVLIFSLEFSRYSRRGIIHDADFLTSLDSTANFVFCFRELESDSRTLYKISNNRQMISIRDLPRHRCYWMCGTARTYMVRGRLVYSRIFNLKLRRRVDDEWSSLVRQQKRNDNLAARKRMTGGAVTNWPLSLWFKTQEERAEIPTWAFECARVTGTSKTSSNERAGTTGFCLELDSWIKYFVW